MTDIKIFAENVEQSALDQIEAMRGNPVFENSKIRIMPDCHAGSGCVIGTTATFEGKIQPSFIGVDIGCGVTAIGIWDDINAICFSAFDDFVRSNIPSGFSVHPRNTFELEELQQLNCFESLKNVDRLLKSKGTLGGGNHFIELAQGSEKAYIIVHSGSRNIGLQVASHYERIAKEYGGFLEDDIATEYIEDMRWCQEFARVNRINILLTLGKFLHLSGTEVSSVHNYISTKDNILRKGAISACAGEECIIPLNMRDGSLLCRGKGNPDWNHSAPHGAGRIISRKQAKESLDIDVFRQSMNGIFTTSVCESTIDESPMAYKDMEYILRMIEPTVEVVDVLKPVYNFKAV